MTDSSKLKKERKEEKTMRRGEIAQDHLSIQKAERFIMQVYYLISKVDAMVSVLNYAPALRKFEQFVAYEASNCSTTLALWIETRKFDHKLGEQESMELARVLYDNFLDDAALGDSHVRVMLPSWCKRKIMILLSKKPCVYADLMAAFADIDTELLNVLGNVQFPKFLESKYYTSWRCQERGHASGLALEYVLLMGTYET